MCVEGSQAILQLRGALTRGFLAKKGHLKRLPPPATACAVGTPLDTASRGWGVNCAEAPCGQKY